MLLCDKSNRNAVTNGAIQKVADLRGGHVSRAFLETGIAKHATNAKFISESKSENERRTLSRWWVCHLHVVQQGLSIVLQIQNFVGDW